MKKTGVSSLKCGGGFIAVDEVHLENKKQVSAWAFWQGGALGIGDRYDREKKSQKDLRKLAVIGVAAGKAMHKLSGR